MRHLAAVPGSGDGEDQGERLRRFRAANPRVIVLTKGPVPEAIPLSMGGERIRRPTLGELLDVIEPMFPPGTTEPGAPGPLARADRRRARHPHPAGPGSRAGRATPPGRRPARPLRPPAPERRAADCDPRMQGLRHRGSPAGGDLRLGPVRSGRPFHRPPPGRVPLLSPAPGRVHPAPLLCFLRDVSPATDWSSDASSASAL